MVVGKAGSAVTEYIRIFFCINMLLLPAVLMSVLPLLLLLLLMMLCCQVTMAGAVVRVQRHGSCLLICCEQHVKAAAGSLLLRFAAHCVCRPQDRHHTWCAAYKQRDPWQGQV
jgi:hypothetical protein